MTNPNIKYIKISDPVVFNTKRHGQIRLTSGSPLGYADNGENIEFYSDLFPPDADNLLVSKSNPNVIGWLKKQDPQFVP